MYTYIQQVRQIKKGSSTVLSFGLSDEFCFVCGLIVGWVVAEAVSGNKIKVKYVIGY